jgi:hypothetical protein
MPCELAENPTPINATNSNTLFMKYVNGQI